METVSAKKVGPKQQSGTGMSTIRLIVTLVIIVACFSALYPKFFHPIVLRMLGFSQPKQKTDSIPTHPPHRPMPGGGDPRHDDIKRHMRPGPHPGMRAAAEMNKQKQGSSGRGGMMGMILPVYAFGIIGYLVYTLVKVFGKKDSEGDSKYGRQGRNDGQNESETNSQQEQDDSNKLKGLEDLLSKASNVDPNISAEEMRELQKRLEETEKQMSQILSAMKQVSTKVNTVATDADKSGEQEKPKDDNSSDSSPDISSYEVVDKNKEKTTPGVKTVKASETEDAKDKEGDISQTNGIEKDGEELKDSDEIIKDKQEEEESGLRQRKVPQDSKE